MELEELIPPRYLYDSEVGTDYWVNLCSDPEYSYFQTSHGFFHSNAGQLVRQIKDTIGAEFGFVSLGPGDGRKDLEILRACVNGKLNVVYHPYDVSPRMLGCTARTIRKLNAPAVPVSAVVGEFDEIAELKDGFAVRDAPRVISVLGNSLGNVSDELAFITNLRPLMRVGDLLLLEVRLTHGDEATPPELSRPSARHFYISPLEYYLAANCDIRRVKDGPSDQGLSKITGTNSTLISYEIRHKGKLYDAKLLCINEYDKEQFLKAVESTGFTRLLTRTNKAGSFLVCLLRRVDSQPKADRSDNEDS